MQTNLEQLSRIKELAFMGKVTASLSHEIKNTLAIINESVGLMGDLLNKEPPAGWQPHSRLQSIIASVEEQVQRSGVIVKRLNRFAHSMDNEAATVDLNEMVREITTLAERFARLQGVQLAVQSAPESLLIQGDPFRIQYVIFGFIEHALNWTPKEGTVTVMTNRSGEMAQVVITDQGTVEIEKIREQISGSAALNSEYRQSELPVLVQITAKLGGNIAAEQAAEAGNTIILSFPARASGV